MISICGVKNKELMLVFFCDCWSQWLLLSRLGKKNASLVLNNAPTLIRNVLELLKHIMRKNFGREYNLVIPLL